MALRKEIELDSGVVVTYWKITNHRIHDNNRTASIEVTPYLTKEARDNDKAPVLEGRRNITCKDEPMFNKEQYTDYLAKEALSQFAVNDGLDIYKVMYKFLSEQSEMLCESWACQDCQGCIHADECPDYQVET